MGEFSAIACAWSLMDRIEIQKRKQKTFQHLRVTVSRIVKPPGLSSLQIVVPL